MIIDANISIKDNEIILMSIDVHLTIAILFIIFPIIYSLKLTVSCISSEKMQTELL